MSDSRSQAQLRAALLMRDHDPLLMEGPIHPDQPDELKQYIMKSRETIAADVGDSRDDPLVVVLGKYVEALSRAVGEISDDALDRFSELSFCVTELDHMSAGLEVFEDASGLVKIHTGALVAIQPIASEAGRAVHNAVSDRSFRGLRRLKRGLAQEQPEIQHDYSGFYEFLRSVNIHRRAATPHQAIFMADPPPNFSIRVVQASQIFLAAHEAAHYLMRHTDEEGVDPGRELDADRMALGLTSRAMEIEEGGECSCDLVAALGALAAILAVDNHSRVELVHSGSTHPPMTDRFYRLLSLVGPAEYDWVAAVYNGIAQVVVDAGQFTPDARRFNPRNIPTASFYDSAAMSRAVKFDALLSADAGVLFREIEKVNTDVTPGCLRAISGDVPSALAEWGVDRENIAVLDCKNRALSIRELRSWISRGIARRYGLEEDDSPNLVLALTVLATRPYAT